MHQSGETSHRTSKISNIYWAWYARILFSYVFLKSKLQLIIGQYRSYNLNTGLWLVISDHVTWILSSDWSLAGCPLSYLWSQLSWSWLTADGSAWHCDMWQSWRCGKMSLSQSETGIGVTWLCWTNQRPVPTLLLIMVGDSPVFGIWDGNQWPSFADPPPPLGDITNI